MFKIFSFIDLTHVIDIIIQFQMFQPQHLNSFDFQTKCVLCDDVNEHDSRRSSTLLYIFYEILRRSISMKMEPRVWSSG